MNTMGSPINGEKRDEIARRSVQCLFGAHNVCMCLARKPLNLQVGEQWVAEDRGIDQEVIQSAPVSADDHQTPNIESAGSIEGKLEICVTLVDWMSLDGDAVGVCQCSSRNGIQVPNDEVDLKTKDVRLIEARIGGYHEGGGGKVIDDRWVHRIAAGKNHHRIRFGEAQFDHEAHSPGPSSAGAAPVRTGCTNTEDTPVSVSTAA